MKIRILMRPTYQYQVSEVEIEHDFGDDVKDIDKLNDVIQELQNNATVMAIDGLHKLKSQVDARFNVDRHDIADKQVKDTKNDKIEKFVM